MIEGLNNEQSLAAKAVYGPVMVFAGAGSGKTFVLTERVIHFIKNHGYHLSDFLILTFTNLAAGEMKERIRKKLKENNLEDAALVDTSNICTFDSYALSLVKKYHYLLGARAHQWMACRTIMGVMKQVVSTSSHLFSEL